ncbi:MBL fold metallo-hydrolase [bacterium]|nr:MBL fold metallo-hydrolase [bacterium]
MGPIDNLVPLIDNLFWVEAPGKGKFPFCNGFLLTGKETVLIDAGIGGDLIKKIDAHYKIDSLIISHSHPDHIMFWHLLSDRRIIMPKETPDVICDLTMLGKRFTGTLEKAERWKKRIADGFGLKAMRLPDERYAEGEHVGNDEVKLRAIHAPGHLNDHYCFFHQDSGLLLSTDIDFDSFGPWYGNPECSIDLFKKSIQKVRSLPFRTVCSSHKPPLDRKNGEEAFAKYTALFDRQKEKVYNLCQQPRTLHQLIKTSPFYRDLMPDKQVQDIFEEQLIRKNLDLLEAAGSIKLENGQYRQV